MRDRDRRLEGEQRLVLGDGERRRDSGGLEVGDGARTRRARDGGRARDATADRHLERRGRRRVLALDIEGDRDQGTAARRGRDLEREVRSYRISLRKRQDIGERGGRAGESAEIGSAGDD